LGLLLGLDRVLPLGLVVQVLVVQLLELVVQVLDPVLGLEWVVVQLLDLE